MKIINGEGMVLGRLGSFVAKELLKGEEIAIINSEKVIITGNKEYIKTNFEIKRSRFGSSQKGPKHPAVSEKMVKRVVRGMLPDHRVGRGSEAIKRLKCYNKIPKEFEGKEIIELNKEKKIKYSKLKELAK